MTDLEQRIRLKCVECGDCLLWEGRVSTRGGLPEMHVSRVGNRHVRPALYKEWHGSIPKGLEVTPTCGNKMCLAREHLEAMTHKRSCKIASKRGAYQNPAKIRKGALTNVAKSWITAEVISAVRGAESARRAHEITGVSLSHVKNIRRGTARPDYANPFLNLMAASNDGARRAA